VTIYEIVIDGKATYRVLSGTVAEAVKKALNAHLGDEEPRNLRLTVTARTVPPVEKIG
jgi:hypothetical protein